MASTFTPDGSNGGTFDCEAGTYAVGRVTLTTAAPDDEVSLKFLTTRRPLVFRVGTASGEQDIYADIEFRPGVHVVSFTPGVSPYYVEFQLQEVGEAGLYNFTTSVETQLSIASPWTEADLPGLRSEQSLDVQWWTHGDYQPRVLERRSNTSWSLRRFAPADGPFEADDLSGITMTPSARTGTATITSSRPAFKTTDANSLIMLRQSGQFQSLTAGALDDQTDEITVSGSGASRTFYYSVTGTFTATVVLERSVGNTASWVTVATHTSAVSNQAIADGLDGQIVYYRLRVSAYTSGAPALEVIYSGGVTEGIARIFSVTADNSVTADVLEPFAALTATSEWARGSWSDRYGWPDAVALHQGRLAFIRDGRRWQSSPELYESFPFGADDDDVIDGSIPGPLNEARWLKSLDGLIVGTGGGVGDISTGSFDEVMTPLNTRARMRRQRGSANADAVIVDDAPVYIHRAGRKLYLVDPGEQQFELLNLCRLHSRIAGGVSGQFVELAYQSEPEPRLYAVRDDGQLVVMLINLDERIGAFCRTVPCGTSAEIESVCVTPGTPEDSVYLSTKRTVQGEVRRYIEKLAPEQWADSEDAWRLDCAESYDGSATSTLSGLDHLIGESVYVWGNGRVSGPLTVDADGEVTLTYQVTKAIVGYRYQGKYKGPRQLPLIDYKKPDKLGFIVHETMSGGIGWGKSFTSEINPATGKRVGWNYIADQTSGGSYDTALTILSEDKEFPIDGSWERDARICLEFTGVGPSTILCIVPRLNVNR